MEPEELADLDFCYVTTTGRRTGHPHTIEIWFALEDELHVYMLSGGGDAADWVRNVVANPTVGLRIGDQDMIAKARVIDDPQEDATARRMLFEKYTPRYHGGDLTEWRDGSLPVAIDLPNGPAISQNGDGEDR